MNTHLPVVETHFRQRAVAPAVTVVRQLPVGNSENLVGLFRDIHFLGAEVLAAIVGLHNQAMS
ncbi:MAG: hypothetical protein H7Y43_16510 [Akkermansiaceae bacterium]|nr:hypothetical protein [Verrucomicrobiales bacterium]